LRWTLTAHVAGGRQVPRVLQLRGDLPLPAQLVGDGRPIWAAAASASNWPQTLSIEPPFRPAQPNRFGERSTATLRPDVVFSANTATAYVTYCEAFALGGGGNGP